MTSIQKNFFIHPLFIAFALFLVLLGQAVLLFNTLTSVILHELAHAYSAKTRGYTVSGIRLMPYGATVGIGGALTNKDEIAIALAGPVFNLIVASIITAFWWLYPSTYGYTRTMAIAHFAIGIFNLLPFYPLDMSRVILAFAKSDRRVLIALRLAGIFFSIVCIVAWIVSLFNTPNHTLIIVGALLLDGALKGIRNKKEEIVLKKIGIIKNYQNGVNHMKISYNESIPLIKIMRIIDDSSQKTFNVVNETGNYLGSLDEKDIMNAISSLNRNSTLSDALNLKNTNKP